MRIDSREHHAATHSIPSSPDSDKSRVELPSIKIRVRGLGEGENPVDFSVDAAVLDYAPFEDTVRIHGSLVRAGEQIHLKATASAEGSFECTRCTEPFRRIIDAPIALEFVPPRLERDPNDPNVHVYDAAINAYLDITEDVRDALALAIPMKHLCRPDCKGLCPVCGKDLNKGPCGHLEQSEEEIKFPALKSLGERLRAEEGNAGPSEHGLSDRGQ